jgi:hypothetical protein
VKSAAERYQNHTPILASSKDVPIEAAARRPDLGSPTRRARSTPPPSSSLARAAERDHHRPPIRTGRVANPAARATLDAVPDCVAVSAASWPDLVAAPDRARAVVARAFERERVAEPCCPRCGTQLSSSRWDVDGPRRTCTSCVGDGGNVLLVRDPTDAERAALPGLRTVYAVAGVAKGAPTVWLDVDRDAFVAACGGLVLSADALADAARSPDAAERLRVVAHPAVSPAILASLIDDPDDDVRLRVVKHPRTPAAALAARAANANANAKERAALAAHDDTPDDVLLRLVESNERPVMQALAARSFPPDAVVAALKKRGWQIKPPKKDPFGTAYDPESGLTPEEWQRAIEESYRH